MLGLSKNDKPSIVLDKKNRSTIQSAVNNLKKTLKKQFNKTYFLSRKKYYVISFLLFSFFFFTIVMATRGMETPFVWVLFAIFLLFIRGFLYLLKGYTKEGLLIKRDIEGFKLFLSTTEEDRLKVVGTPPTKTPQLYETYLPYAIALGVEKQWSAKFAPVFEELNQKGTPYAPLWYIGLGKFDMIDAGSLSTDLSRSLDSSSGSGGNGSSGGGGGGGGGGSW